MRPYQNSIKTLICTLCFCFAFSTWCLRCGASWIYRAVKFTSKLFGRALSRRIKATVLYATETGKSEQFSKKLVELLGHAFNAQVNMCKNCTFYNLNYRNLVGIYIQVNTISGSGSIYCWFWSMIFEHTPVCECLWSTPFVYEGVYEQTLRINV